MSSIEIENAFRVIDNEISSSTKLLRKILSDSAINNTSVKEIKIIAEKIESLESLIKKSHQLKTDILGLQTRNENINREFIEKGRAHRGERLPQIEYRIPILKVLKQMGGRGETKVVIDRIFPLIQKRLSEIDYQNVPARNEIRWRNVAMWERNAMKEAGLLSSTSRRGVWEMTEKGYKYLVKHEKD